MDNEQLPCGCSSEKQCETAQKLFAQWEAAARCFERLPTGGNEYALRKAFDAYHNHFRASPVHIPPPPRVPGVQ
jgi:hypothetical protein